MLQLCERDRVDAAFGDVVADDLDLPALGAGETAPGGLGGTRVDVDQDDLAGAAGDPAQRQIVAIARADDRDPRALVREELQRASRAGVQRR